MGSVKGVVGARFVGLGHCSMVGTKVVVAILSPLLSLFCSATGNKRA